MVGPWGCLVQPHASPLLRGGTGWLDTCSGPRSSGVVGLGSGPPSLPLLHTRCPSNWEGAAREPWQQGCPRWWDRRLGLEGVGAPGRFSYRVPTMVPEASPAKLNAEAGGFLHETEMGTWGPGLADLRRLKRVASAGVTLGCPGGARRANVFQKF